MDKGMGETETRKRRTFGHMDRWMDVEEGRELKKSWISI